ncbi:hypothetical protein UP17_23000 [Peribacillus simplex]|nr:hypothetical protein UP17_23000 [Peribacillus simplex]
MLYPFIAQATGGSCPVLAYAITSQLVSIDSVFNGSLIAEMMGNPLGAYLFHNDFLCGLREVPGEIIGIGKATVRANKNIIVKGING